MARPDADLVELLQRDQSGTQAIVDVMVVVADLVGQIAQLRLDGGLRPLDEAPPEIAQLMRLLRRAVLEDAFARFVGEVEAVECAIALLQQINGAQALQIVLEAAVIPHAGIERILAGMAERRMSEVVGEGDGLGQVLVEAHRARQGAGNLRHLDAVSEAGAEEIAFVIDEDLRLVFQAAKRGGMDDPIPVALVFAARGRRWLRMHPPLGVRLADGIGGRFNHGSTPRWLRVYPAFRLRR